MDYREHSNPYDAPDNQQPPTSNACGDTGGASSPIYGDYGAPESINGFGQTPPPPPPQKRTGFAIASLVLGLVSICGICCCLNVITAPLALIFGIIALSKKQNGMGLSIAGIITAALSLVVTIAFFASFSGLFAHADEISADYARLMEEQDTVFPEYEKTGKLPDYLDKYQESPYTEMMDKYDITIYDIMDVLLTSYQNGSLKMYGTAYGSSLPDFSRTSSRGILLFLGN